MKGFFLLLRTISHLRLSQILYRLHYGVRERLRSLVRYKYKYNLYRKGKALNFTEGIPSITSYENGAFTFLNRKVAFNRTIEWDYSDNGKLWTYNLNYFDYLNQEGFDKDKGVELIMDFIDDLPQLTNANEPYTISLRGINWVKFLSREGVEKKSIDQYLFSQYRVLLDKLEYHIQGNHLLENGFSLIFGAYYFNDKELYDKGLEIVKAELEEQILNDGAHYELSPMYHRIILFRLLDLINLVENNKEQYDDAKFLSFLQEKASAMLAWLKKVTLKNGDTPNVNDSTEGIIHSSDELIEYAERLGLKASNLELDDSGYRMYQSEQWELFVDVGNIGPDYIPGHAHSDTFNFLLNIEEKPFIVESGISTYEKGFRRQRERGTSSHNTVRYDQIDQSEVWGAFRVGRRAKVFIDAESDTSVLAYHDGYKRFGIFHYRKFEFDKEEIVIQDEMYAKRDILGVSHAYFHFPPDMEPNIQDSGVEVNGCQLSFEGEENIKLKDYHFARGYNDLVKAKLIEVEFKERLTTRITYKRS